jgi:two-component system uhpT operon response regulator UhpA
LNTHALIVKVSAFFISRQERAMTTIALIDDHLIVRSGFAQLLNLEPDFQVVAEFGSGREALAGLPGRGVQVCICDISMPDLSGLELLTQLPKGMATIMLSVHDSPALVEQALNAGRADSFPNAVARTN